MTTATIALDIDATITAIVNVHGASARARAQTGVNNVARRWTAAEGDATAFQTFCTDHFVADDEQLARLLSRFETALEQIHGHLYEMRRNLRRWSDLRGDDFPRVDDLLATFDPAPDFSEQVYRQRLAFIGLLNFHRPDLSTMLSSGASWSIDEWAQARIAQAFSARIPVSLNDKAREVGHSCQQWVATFHVPVGRMIDAKGKRWFEPDRKLIAHWLIREEIKSCYNDPAGIDKQRALAWVMARHIDGSIPKSVMDGTATGDWNPQHNTLSGTAEIAGSGGGTGASSASTPVSAQLGLARYERWLEQFALAREFDAHYPECPTAIARKFELAREIPEADVERLIVELLSHPARQSLTRLLRDRVGRDLESFDVYFDDIAEKRSGEEMNAAVFRLFPDEKSFERQLPQVLRGLGFPADKAEFLGTRIRVEIAKGAGHAMRPALTEYGAWLRTSRLDTEFGWDGFDTAMHELGHNIEQLCSTNFVPRPALRGVPNTACTEAFAFLYQSLAKQVLGLTDAASQARAFTTDAVQTALAACQIAGPSLMELRVWRWLYAHPDANATDLRQQVLSSADDIWNQFYAPHFGADPYRLTAAYQHMIAHPLYLADYTLGHIISHQIRSAMRGRDTAAETMRICSLGRLTPRLWMQKAVGSPVAIDSLMRDAEAGCAQG
ncbi:MAG: hypothetical protein EXS00_08700 [Phycisphaerales bacterium]|nr:hypothetical protein [Phycisphaerales bacterium]